MQREIDVVAIEVESPRCFGSNARQQWPRQEFNFLNGGGEPGYSLTDSSLRHLRIFSLISLEFAGICIRTLKTPSSQNIKVIINI
jgi:hypothetical protein